MLTDAVQAVRVPMNTDVLTKPLTKIAHAESNDWSGFIKKFTEKYKTDPRLFLNEYKAQINASDDAQLNRLFRRAVDNLNANQTDQADAAPIFREHYTSSPFLIPDANVNLDVHPDKVIVTTTLKVERNRADVPLILNCKEQDVKSVKVNGRLLTKEEYCATKCEIIIPRIHADGPFFVETVCEINPYSESQIKGAAGMYQSGKHLTTQCEAEDASRIFPILDRPDIATRYTTQITADPKTYPVMISNGDLQWERTLDDGRKSVCYLDDFPKPSYLFAAVLGTFDSVEGTFTTAKGREVKLKILVEKGQAERGKFALEALKEALKLDEVQFGRIYNHNTLTCAAMDVFTAGAMENTTLIIYNSRYLLVDKNTGTDQQFRDVAHVVYHEHDHNARGGLVRIKHFFQIALKEAFTDWCAKLKERFRFGEEYARIGEIIDLQNKAFPKITAKTGGHPLIVDSYVNPFNIYDQITYTGGREVFQAFARFIDTYVNGGSRKALDDYFKTNKGKAVTFEALLASGNKILAPVGKNLDQFKLWFEQQGVPKVHAHFRKDKVRNTAFIKLMQSNIHPETEKDQLALPIPFSYELLRKDGSVYFPRMDIILEEKEQAIEITQLGLGEEELIPVFMHGYSAPVMFNYPYTFEQLATIAVHSNDVYCKWRAGQDYTILALKEIMRRRAEGNNDCSDLVQFYKKALESHNLSNVAKSQLLQLPSLQDLAQKLDCYDFQLLGEIRGAFLKEITGHCKSCLLDLYVNLPKAEKYEPTKEQMGVRDLRNTCLQLLVAYDPEHFALFAWKVYQENRHSENSPSANFTDGFAAFSALVQNKTKYKADALKDFYEDWKGDKTVFINWLSAQCSGDCNVEELRKLPQAFEGKGETLVGFDETLPNHLRAIYRTFMENLVQYHKPDGSGYRFAVDAILEIGKTNEDVSHGYLYETAVANFFNLPAHQQALLANELKRLLCNDSPVATQNAVKELLANYEKSLQKVV